MFKVSQYFPHDGHIESISNGGKIVLIDPPNLNVARANFMIYLLRHHKNDNIVITDAHDRILTQDEIRLLAAMMHD